MLYQLIVFLHVISAFAFLLSHGAAASVAFALKRERDPQKIRTLLDLSTAPIHGCFGLWLQPLCLASSRVFN